VCKDDICTPCEAQASAGEPNPEESSGEQEKQELKAEFERMKRDFGLGPRGRDEPLPTDAQIEQRRQMQLRALAGGNGSKSSHGGNGHKSPQGDNGSGSSHAGSGSQNDEVGRSLRVPERPHMPGPNPPPEKSVPGEKVDAANEIRALNFNESLCRILKPRSRSDRTCFRNVTNWLFERHACGVFGQEVFARVLDFAREAGAGNRPAAVFMAILKKELGYGRAE
jgi:hypothetical protein